MHGDGSWTLSLEFDAIDVSASWQQWEALGVGLAAELPARMLTALLHRQQLRLLEEVCGPRWRPVRGVTAPFSCPKCGVASGFSRKGRRGRVRGLDTAVGTVRFRLWNVQCRSCERVFAPLLELLGLVRVRRSDRLTFTLAQLATDVSFGRAARIAGDIGHMPATAARAHASLADVAALLGELAPAVAAPDVVLLDGTGARAGTGKLGVAVNLAVGLLGRDGPLRRRRAHAAWLGATVDQDWSAMARQLAGLQPPAVVVVDGEEELICMVKQLWPHTPIQRCWWHLPYGLARLAYEDPARPDPRWTRAKGQELGQLVSQAFSHNWNRDEALDAWDTVAASIPAQFTRLRSYLAKARPHAFTFLDHTLQQRLAHLGGVDLATGVIERLMRETNARTDIGGSRWSIPGLRDLITVKTAAMLNHPVWEHLRKETLTPNTIGFALTANVNA